MSNSWPVSSKWSKLKNLVHILVRVCHTVLPIVSPKLAFVLCLPRFCNPNIDQLCRQKLAYYIPVASNIWLWLYIAYVIAHETSWHRFHSESYACNIELLLRNFYGPKTLKKWWPLPWEDLRRTSIHKRIQGERSRKATQNYLNCCFWIVIEHNQVLLHHWNH